MQHSFTATDQDIPLLISRGLVKLRNMLKLDYHVAIKQEEEALHVLAGLFMLKKN